MKNNSQKGEKWVDGPDFIQRVKQLDPEGSVIGYARVSTDDQDLALQIQALKDAGCVRIYKEQKSTRKKRPVFELVRDQVTRGNDVLIVWRLDRLGRDVVELLQTVEMLYQKGVRIRSLHENVDAETANGRLMLNIIASFAQYERDLTRERTIAGIAEAKRRGVEFGQPTKIFGEKRVSMLVDVWNLELTNKQITERAGYKSAATLFNRFPGERQKVRDAYKEGDAWFKKARKEAFEKCAQEEGVSLKRLREIIKEKSDD